MQNNSTIVDNTLSVQKIELLKQSTHDVQTSMLKLITAIPLRDMPISEDSFQQLILFITDSCELVEQIEIKKELVV